MGCDIHLFVEQRRKVNGQLKWISGDYFKFNYYYESGDSKDEYSLIELHGDRNYSLFSTLAGVRDYSEKNTPISEPKGVPNDCCEYVKTQKEYWDGDGHSHSWFTLKELKDYQSTSPLIHYSGVISPEDVENLDKHGKTPQSWCQGTNMVGYERREWSEPNDVLVPLIEKLQARAKELFQYDWQVYNPENDDNIRIVFWFDN